jgi:hypothetical protein
VKFSFEAQSPLIDAALQIIRCNIFMEEEHIEIVHMCSAHRESATIHELLECYNVAKEYQEEEDPRNVQVPKTKGEHIVVGPELESDAYENPLRV